VFVVLDESGATDTPSSAYVLGAALKTQDPPALQFI
jgi:hypothetical protein